MQATGRWGDRREELSTAQRPEAVAMPAPRDPPVPTSRYLLAWAILLVGLVGFWGCRPWLDVKTFNYGQFVVLLLTWKIASLLCLPPGDWARFPFWRRVAYLVWIGMQPRLFLVGREPNPGAPAP